MLISVPSSLRDGLRLQSGRRETLNGAAIGVDKERSASARIDGTGGIGIFVTDSPVASFIPAARAHFAQRTVAGTAPCPGNGWRTAGSCGSCWRCLRIGAFAE